MLFNFIIFPVLVLLVIIHELGHFIAAKLNNVKVEEFGFGLPPRIFGIKIGETLYSINLLPLGGFVKVFGEEAAELEGKKVSPTLLKRSFSHKKPLQKCLILTAGVLCNFLLGWVIVSFLFIQGVRVPTKNILIDKVTKDSPAYIVGLQKGDSIRKIIKGNDEIIIDEPSDVSLTTRKFAGEEITLVIERNKETQNVLITPRENPPKGEGSLCVLISNYEIRKYSIVKAPIFGLIESARMTILISKELSKTLFQLIILQKPDAEIAGPVGIAKLTAEAARQGYDSLLQLVGLLSLNLAIINILPFPALDGGRLMLVIYEWVSRRKVNPTIERRLNFAGFAILIGLIILVTINDIVKLL